MKFQNYSTKTSKLHLLQKLPAEDWLTHFHRMTPFFINSLKNFSLSKEVTTEVENAKKRRLFERFEKQKKTEFLWKTNRKKNSPTNDRKNKKDFNNVFIIDSMGKNIFQFCETFVTQADRNHYTFKIQTDTITFDSQ